MVLMTLPATEEQQQNFSCKTSFDVTGQYTLGQTNLINNKGFLFMKHGKS
jgi:hypothetical protein